MKRKFQVFISSTYMDLQSERRAAIEAVVNAGHIPVGMEMFKSGNLSQIELIKKSIDDCTIYMLILGGRYGSIDEESNLSYTNWEYEYALNKGKPIFSLIITDEALKNKVSNNPEAGTEKEYLEQYNQFKKKVMSFICKTFEDEKDIRNIVFESLTVYKENDNLKGWIDEENVLEHPEVVNLKNDLMNECAKKVNDMVKTYSETTKKLEETSGLLHEQHVDLIKRNESLSLREEELNKMEKEYYGRKINWDKFVKLTLIIIGIIVTNLIL